jgi:hypothetical protein
LNATIQSTLFYTLSTVAQTLAGAMGLLGAIVLFSLQTTARSIERAAKQLSAIPHADLNALYIRHLFTRRSYHEIARRYGDLLEGSIETSQDLLVHHSTLVWELQQEEAIRRSFWTSLLGSGLVIGWSIVGLSLVPELTESVVTADLFLGSAVVGALGCLLLFGVLLRVMVRSATMEDTTTAMKR